MNKSRVTFATNPGPRPNFEDAVDAFCLTLYGKGEEDISELVVGDGVAGNRFGEVASAMGVTQISSFLAASFASSGSEFRCVNLSPDTILDALEESFNLANRAILRQASEQPELKGMATTAVCALIVNSVLYTIWAGDSRCYLCSLGTVKQITHDHSEVQKLVDAGIVDEQDAKTHPLGHTITQFLGKPKGFACDTKVHRLEPGDVIVLCTDGLSDVVSKDQIGAQIAAYQSGNCDFEDLPSLLIQQALNAGTTDNVTVLCCEYRPKIQPCDRTLTGAYPAAAARTIRNMSKETSL